MKKKEIQIHETPEFKARMKESRKMSRKFDRQRAARRKSLRKYPELFPTTLTIVGALPDFAVELEKSLRKQRRGKLARQIATLPIMERCRCGGCATFDTAPRPMPDGRYGKGHYNLEVTSVDEPHDFSDYENLNDYSGYERIYLDMVKDKIYSIEVLGRPDVHAALFSALLNARRELLRRRGFRGVSRSLLNFKAELESALRRSEMIERVEVKLTEDVECLLVVKCKMRAGNTLRKAKYVFYDILENQLRSSDFTEQATEKTAKGFIVHFVTVAPRFGVSGKIECVGTFQKEECTKTSASK